VHKSLNRILEKRQESLRGKQDIDWATAEALAMGSLCLEGHHVRVSGQDVERGTFSQRHAVLHDQNHASKITPLDTLSSDQARFTIGNSSLSEYGVMGFDYGYSCMHPNALVMWEAQFGDFANNAQCIIDQFIASGEDKWMLRSGLVLSLPHGFDGQGSEHSSARMERFLQLCNEDARFYPSQEKLERKHQDANIQVVCMTTPANLFHVLRRQLHREFRKRKLNSCPQQNPANTNMNSAHNLLLQISSPSPYGKIQHHGLYGGFKIPAFDLGPKPRSVHCRACQDQTSNILHRTSLHGIVKLSRDASYHRHGYYSH
jgi:2-oxoglutarate dehydrogenase complex dehydrogenase (E1) component-like enzyme